MLRIITLAAAALSLSAAAIGFGSFQQPASAACPVADCAACCGDDCGACCGDDCGACCGDVS